MTDETINLLSTMFLWTGIYALGAASICAAVQWWFSELCNAIWPPSAAEIAHQQARRIVFWANVKANWHLFKGVGRRSFRVLRFWNI